MNSEELKGKWMQIKGKFREKWSKLTDDDWEQVKGNKEKIIGKIKEKYGINQEAAEKEFHEFIDKNKNE